MILRNCTYLDENFIQKKADIRIKDGIIYDIGQGLKPESGEDDLDYSDYRVIPGFVDIHNHGCLGCDASDGKPDNLRKIARFLLKRGVTSFCPTTMTIAPESISKALKAVRTVMDDQHDDESWIAGVNMEGPFISMKKKGGQNAEYIRKPDIDMFEELQEQSGNIIKLVDIAPECDEDFRFIKKISQKCVVSAAHTTADYDTAIESFDAGIRHATHLFNAMTGFNHRAPGMVGAVFEDDRITAELICDGFHIHPSVIQTVFKLIPDRIAVISDSISLNGMPEGTEALLGEQKIFSNGKTAVMDDGTIAGSITNLYAEFKNLLLWGIPFETAVKSLTLIPAESVGIADKTGSIKKGKKADLIVLRRSLEIAAVYHS